jgi:CheY-like chemotaxis protein
MAKIAPPAPASDMKPNDEKVRPAAILLADDAEEMRAVISMRLRQCGYSVTECCNGAELLAELGDYLGNVPVESRQRQFDLIISDIRMPGVFGTSVVEGGTEYGNFPPTILITAFGDEETHEKARHIGVAAVLDKPFDMNDLMTKVSETLTGSPSV